MDRRDLVAGTRPPLRDKIIVTASDSFDGYEITEYKGMVWGISMRAKDFGQDCMMGCKNFTGGELTSYTEMGDEARQKAMDRMLEMAGRLKANGIIDFRNTEKGGCFRIELPIEQEETDHEWQI